MVACSHKPQHPPFPDRPTKEGYEGFEWEIVSGKDIKFWAQRNESLSIVIDDSLPGAVLQRSWSASHSRVMQLFELPTPSIDDVLQQLSQLPEWDSTQTCRFKEIESRRMGVKRYILIPSETYGEEIDKMSRTEPIPSPCNGWGVCNSGMRYFEIHENAPHRALFVEIGQDAPLFDENSMVITDNR